MKKDKEKKKKRVKRAISSPASTEVSPLEGERSKKHSLRRRSLIFYVLPAENGKSAFCGPCGMGRPAATERLSPLYRASQT